MGNLLIIVAYLLLMIGAGIYSMRKAKRVEGFFLADRRVGVPLCVGSICATAIGGSCTIGLAGLGFKLGLVGSWWLLVGTAGLVILSFLFASKVRKTNSYTLPELVGKIYDERTRLVASLLIVICWVGVIAGQILATGTILSILTPWSFMTSVIICSSVFIVYTTIGGQYSIFRTDFIQFGIMVIGVCLLALPLSLHQAGGWIGLKEALPQGHLSFPLGPNMGWMELISLLLLVGAPYVVGPDMYSRLFATKDNRTAKVSALYSGLLLIPFAFSIALIGMCALVLFPQISPEEAIPKIIISLLPQGISGLVLAAFLAALMSSADTCLLTTSTILTMDIYRPFFNPKASERKTLQISRMGIIIIGLLALLIAFKFKSVISALLLSYTVFTSGLAIPVILGFYKERIKVNANGALAGLIGGGGTALIVKLSGIGERIKGLNLLGLLVCLILLFLFSRLTSKSSG